MSQKTLKELQLVFPTFAEKANGKITLKWKFIGTENDFYHCLQQQSPVKKVFSQEKVFTGNTCGRVLNIFLKFYKFHKKTPVLESLFNKISLFSQVRPATLLKRDSNRGVFL